MPASEQDSMSLLMVLDSLVAEHSSKLTPPSEAGREALERLKPVMRFLVELRLVMVCQNYTAAIKPLLVGAMREDACLAHPMACAPEVVQEAEKRVQRLSAAVDHYQESTVALLGGGTFTAAQMNAAVEMVRSIHLVLSVSDASSGSSGSWAARAHPNRSLSGSSAANASASLSSSHHSSRHSIAKPPPSKASGSGRGRAHASNSSSRSGSGSGGGSSSSKRSRRAHSSPAPSPMSPPFPTAASHDNGGSTPRSSSHGSKSHDTSGAESVRSEEGSGAAAFYACVDDIVRSVCPLLESIACNMIITTHLGIRMPPVAEIGAPEHKDVADGERADIGVHDDLMAYMGDGSESRLQRLQAPSPHVQLMETCNLLRMGYHKVPSFYRATLTLIATAVSDLNEPDLEVIPETNRWDRYMVIIRHARVPDLYVICCFTPSVTSVMMGVRAARFSDPAWGHAAGCGDGDAVACVAIAIAAVREVLLEPLGAARRAALLRVGWLISLGALVRAGRAQLHPVEQLLQGAMKGDDGGMVAPGGGGGGAAIDDSSSGAAIVDGNASGAPVDSSSNVGLSGSSAAAPGGGGAAADGGSRAATAERRGSGAPTLDSSRSSLEDGESQPSGAGGRGRGRGRGGGGRSLGGRGGSRRGRGRGSTAKAAGSGGAAADDGSAAIAVKRDSLELAAVVSSGSSGEAVSSGGSGGGGSRSGAVLKAHSIAQLIVRCLTTEGTAGVFQRVVSFL